jgi:pectin methylesterase-like acyl-CoA thioesterase
VTAQSKLRLAPWASLAAAVLLVQPALAQKPAAKKTILVATDGSGQFKTVQEAVDSAPDGNVRIDIKPGEYWQLVVIHANGIELHGLGKVPQDTVLIYDNSAGTPSPDGRQLGTGRSGTVTVTGDDFRAENLTIANNFEWLHGRTNEGAQAVALHVTGDREVFRQVRLLGYQDTLYADSKSCHTPPAANPPSATPPSPAPDPSPCHAARQYFSDCYIAGHVDFIFGDAKAVFDHCEIHAMAHSMVTLTAQSRLRPSEDSGYLFLNCTVTAEPGAPDILFGRPWRDFSTVVFLKTDFKAPLDPKGWLEWGGRLKTSDYAEYGSTGQAGDLAQRVPPSHQLAAADLAKYTTKAWLSSPDNWDPEAIH